MTKRIALSLCAAVIVVTVVGCGGGGGGTGRGGTGGHGGTGATGATGGGACPTGTGTGTLSIVIGGTPSGHGLAIVGPVGTGTEVDTSSDLTLSAGPETVTAFYSAEPGTLVRTAYSPIVDNDSPCIRAGEVTTVHVDYTLIDTSGVVWTGLSNGPTTASLLGFNPATVTATNNTPSVVAADTHGAEGFTFDYVGDL